ncbi:MULTISPECIES: hypothetical protein [Niastella]|uniref:Uncharacterized protein n=1 Tax=Niastella soli TaxID=2821487 RepID=A0ABS3YN26_9BACT|nr:hypothetical protein [Niastella soli]MBO9199277.1 hypothetical protein [Niastella soli]
MTKQISSYKELLEEKARLKLLLAEQEMLIKEDWHLIKEDLRPFTIAGSTLRNLLTRKATTSAMQLGVNLFADGFVKKVLLGNTGWITKMVIPFFIKNFASHITDEPEKIIHKIRNLFKRNKKEEGATQETGMDAV